MINFGAAPFSFSCAMRVLSFIHAGKKPASGGRKLLPPLSFVQTATAIVQMPMLSVQTPSVAEELMRLPGSFRTGKPKGARGQPDKNAGLYSALLAQMC